MRKMDVITFYVRKDDWRVKALTYNIPHDKIRDKLRGLGLEVEVVSESLCG